MSKVCQKCGCENDERYTFCKNCGMPLEDAKDCNSGTYEKVNFEGFYNENVCGTNNAQEIEGVPTIAVSTFVGKNYSAILPKFCTLEHNKSKVAWCWPAAILGLLFGFIGAAFWLLYRKMYKIALLVMALGVVLTVAKTAIMYDYMFQIGSGFKEYASQIQHTNDEKELTEMSEKYGEEVVKITTSKGYSQTSKINEMLNNFESLTAALFFGLFGIGLYKKHAIKKIKDYEEKNGMSEYYMLGLQTLGGTSGLAVVLGVIFAVIVPTVISILPYIIAFI